MSPAVQRVDEWGVQRDWVDANDQPRQLSKSTVERLRSEIGRSPGEQVDRGAIVTRPGRRLPEGSVAVRCEDGTTVSVGERLPGDFPFGYHDLLAAGGASRRLIVSPGVCWLPEGWRAWGWAMQLYAARSSKSWGIGDLADLAELRGLAESLGAEFLLLNPLHAVAPALPQQDSPYLPASRQFRNPIYLRVEGVPGADQRSLADLIDRGRGLNTQPLIDRDQSWQLKREALWQLFSAGPLDRAEFSVWRAESGRPLEDFATWSALAEAHGPDWRAWPEPLRRPGSQDVGAFASRRAQVVSFHAWLQWLVQRQMEEACRGLTVLQDLPVGFDPGGADAWAWQDQTAQGAEIGAPPDLFNGQGQRWGAPPLLPWALAASGYEPFTASVRATMAATGGLRVDHVMGLFRLWWVPDGCPPAEGGYVRYPSDDLLDIVALESHRNKAIVVGEDLGTVEPGVRQTLRARRILSYRVMWFEDEPPSLWPVEAMAAITTHDLPTVAGLWSGDDLREQLAYESGTRDALAHGRNVQLGRLRRSTGLTAEANVDDAILSAHATLADSPATLLVATLDDLVGARQRPNLPGVAGRPNWRLPLPVSVDSLPESGRVHEVARLLGSRAYAVGMANRTMGITEELQDYILDVGVREPDVLRRLRAETAELPEHNMQIAPEEGGFLAMLVGLLGARRCLEVGTFTGYSSTVVALALPADGRLVCCDVSAEWTAVARRYWEQAGVADKVDLRLGPGVTTLDGLLEAGEESTYDFAFIDADKTSYDDYYERVVRLVRPGGLIVFDNTLSHGRVLQDQPDDANAVAIKALNRKLAGDDRVSVVLLPIADGVTLARRRSH